MTSPAIIAIKRAVAAEYGVDVAMIDGPNKSRRAVLPRRVAMYLARDLTQRSTTEIGRAFGHRDHTTVILAERNISGQLQRGDGELAGAVTRLRNRLLSPEGTTLARRVDDFETEMLARLELALSEAADALTVMQRELRRAIARLGAAVARERARLEALRRGDA